MWLGAGILIVLVMVAVANGPATAHAVARIRAVAEGPSTARWLVYGLAALFAFLTGLLPLPAEAAALLNGTLFPPVTALALTWSGAMAGAAAAYECGLRLGRKPALGLFGAERLERVERLIERAGWPTLLALRLSPVMAFTALSWVSGILALSRGVFYWTVAVGLVPGTYLITMAPELLRHGASAARLVALAAAAMLGLFAISYVRVVRRRGEK
jgi:uncharacterized membrane protein YdjX (TVP38/TMEM64 family)